MRFSLFLMKWEIESRGLSVLFQCSVLFYWGGVGIGWQEILGANVVSSSVPLEWSWRTWYVQRWVSFWRADASSVYSYVKSTSIKECLRVVPMTWHIETGSLELMRWLLVKVPQLSLPPRQQNQAIVILHYLELLPLTEWLKETFSQDPG